jgi:hypothetical protein
VYTHSRLSEQFSVSQLSEGRKLVEKCYWKELHNCDFIETSRNFNFDFLRKGQLKIVKTISAYSKSNVSILNRGLGFGFKTEARKVSDPAQKMRTVLLQNGSRKIFNNFVEVRPQDENISLKIK